MYRKIIALTLAAAMLSAELTDFAAATTAPTSELAAKKSVVKTKVVVKKNNAVVKKHVVVKHNGVVKKTVVVKKNGVVHRSVVVVHRPYRRWVRQPYYGTIVAGVAIGTVIAVGAAHAVPAAPEDDLCWYWSDSTETHGYWDYCTPP